MSNTKRISLPRRKDLISAYKMVSNCRFFNLLTIKEKTEACYYNMRYVHI